MSLANGSERAVSDALSVARTPGYALRSLGERAGRPVDGRWVLVTIPLDSAADWGRPGEVPIRIGSLRGLSVLTPVVDSHDPGARRVGRVVDAVANGLGTSIWLAVTDPVMAERAAWGELSASPWVRGDINHYRGAVTDVNWMLAGDVHHLMLCAAGSNAIAGVTVECCRPRLHSSLPVPQVRDRRAGSFGPAMALHR